MRRLELMKRVVDRKGKKIRHELKGKFRPLFCRRDDPTLDLESQWRPEDPVLPPIFTPKIVRVRPVQSRRDEGKKANSS